MMPEGWTIHTREVSIFNSQRVIEELVMDDTGNENVELTVWREKARSHGWFMTFKFFGKKLMTYDNGIYLGSFYTPIEEILQGAKNSIAVFSESLNMSIQRNMK